jgi:aspartate aminotransferase
VIVAEAVDIWLVCDHALTSVRMCCVERTGRYKSRRDAAVAVLEAHGLYEYVPEGAFYLLVRADGRRGGDPIAADWDDVAFCTRLLHEHHVAVSPGSAFGDGAQGYVRVSLASDKEDIVEGIKRLCIMAAAM